MAATKAETPAQKGSSGRGPLPLSILALTQAVLEGLAVAFTGILIAYFMVDRLGYWSLDVYVRASLVGAALYVLIADLTGAYRSEEHTSELQSLMRISYAVFCLQKKTQHTLSSHPLASTDQ